MKAWKGWLGLLCGLALVTAGCMDGGRDIEDEAKEREKFARDNNDYDVVAVLSGPNNVAPGALVWYSAYGSHDPDFLGATQADLQDDDPDAEGTVQYRDDANEVEFSWYMPLFERSNDGLGTGIRSYAWQVDNGPVLYSFDLTDRYESLDGPIRFPVGYTEPGEHTLRLTVTGWDGSSESAEMQVTVAEGGTPSTVSGWHATTEGWVHNRTVELEPQDQGECPGGMSDYDAATHRVSVPWDLVYWMQEVHVVGRWDPITEPAPVPRLDLNLAEVELTLGHCGNGDAWKRIMEDQGIVVDSPSVAGTAGGDEFVGNLDVDGKRTSKTAAWDWNAFFSHSGTYRGGAYANVDVGFVFVPAQDTRSGGL